MALQTKKLTRVFIYNGTELADVAPSAAPTAIAEMYSPAYPELLNASIEGPVMKDDKMVYTFFKAAGGKG